MSDPSNNEPAGSGTDAERAKLDATGEFFSVGLPLHAVRAGYIMRRADEELIRAVNSGRYAHVLSPGRSGKSSLVAASAARLEADGKRVAVIDLEQIGERESGTDSGRWYYNVAYRLLRQLRVRFDLQDWWQDKSVLSNRQRLLDFYSEVLLSSIDAPIVVFVDQIQTIEAIPDASQFLASIRAAHNARTIDPDFQRLTFVLLGECDPVSLIDEEELSPFHITKAIELRDFARADLDLYAAELNMESTAASAALDRIFYWTNGQPYLTQKLARAVSRSTLDDDVNESIDRLAIQQLAGRAALHSEPHMSHIHRYLVNDEKRRDGLLNLYGKLRKGVDIAADLGDPLQCRLMAIGLIVIDDDGRLAVRNRLYSSVFTARWANENLRTRWAIPLVVSAVVAMFLLIPFWYTQWLPGPYVKALVNTETELDVATESFLNFRSFPGHSQNAVNLYRNYLSRSAEATTDEALVDALADKVSLLPDSGRLADEFVAAFWDRKMLAALRNEQRDEALLASIQSLQLATTKRRQQAASLVADDYRILLQTLPTLPTDRTVFDPVSRVITSVDGATISQWVAAGDAMERREDWAVTALEVTPLVRRVVIDRPGTVNRVGLTLTLSHARVDDLRIKIVAPSGRTVDVLVDVQQASSADDIAILGSSLRDLYGESLRGTWSLSIRDESLGVAGQLVGWNLKLNSQGAVEQFERGLNIPDPVELETENVWFDTNGRYAVARASRSDSARIWDLALAEPLRAIAVAESETLIGADAQYLITATEENVNLWAISSGDKVATLAIGPASRNAVLANDRKHLFATRRGDVDTIVESWSIELMQRVARLAVPGAPALLAIDATASHMAIADFNRAVRIWRLADGRQLAQVNLDGEPDSLALSANGDFLAVTYPDIGYSVWSVEDSQQPQWKETGNGAWQVQFSPSGGTAIVGRSGEGFRVLNTQSGHASGPTFAMSGSAEPLNLLSFSDDERFILTAGVGQSPRLWRHTTGIHRSVAAGHQIWNPAADQNVVYDSLAGQFIVADASGHVHTVAASLNFADESSTTEEVSFVGHQSAITALTVDSKTSRFASASTDNTVRVWSAETGAPLPFSIALQDGPAENLVFSRDAKLLAVMTRSGVRLFDSANGVQVTGFDLPAAPTDLVFSDDGKLYVGSQDGALNIVHAIADGRWQIQQVWMNKQGIRKLALSPDNAFLILVDGQNQATQFVLRDGQLTGEPLAFSSAVQDIIFDRSGSRVYIRTHRWVHRLRSSSIGLVWLDALLAPRALPSAKLVLQKSSNSGQRPNRVYLPTAERGFPELFELDFLGPTEEGLLGSRDQLLDEWRSRVNEVDLATF